MIQVSDNGILYLSPRLGTPPQDLIILSAICKYRVSELAEKLGVSVRKLERDFYRHLKRSPKAWLVEQRMLYAKRLLANGCSISEAAARLGFHSTDHFSKEFRLRNGVRPRSWMALRQNQQSNNELVLPQSR